MEAITRTMATIYGGPNGAIIIGVDFITANLIFRAKRTGDRITRHFGLRLIAQLVGTKKFE